MGSSQNTLITQSCVHAYIKYIHIYCTCIYTYNYVYILFFILLSVIRQWNIHTGLCLKELFGHEAFIYRLREGREREGERGREGGGEEEGMQNMNFL